MAHRHFFHSPILFAIPTLMMLTLVSNCLAQADRTSPLSKIKEPNKSPIVCAFFGLDNDLPPRANILVRGAFRKDGMPLNFRDEIDENTLDASDFLVIDSEGTQHKPQGATLRPADEDGENRTVLLVGEFGDDGTNPPVEVRIVGNLQTREKRTEASASSYVMNLKGTSTKNVIPLGNGPKMFFAQILSGDLAERRSSTGQTVQVAWEGGITPVAEDVSEEDLYQFYTVYVDKDGELVPITPKSIADINDNDNYHQLFVDSNDTVIKVAMPPGIVADPNGDPNTATEIEVSYSEPKAGKRD